MKTYAEKRFFEYHEDDVAVSIRAKSGSYGGGSEVLVIAPTSSALSAPGTGKESASNSSEKGRSW